jgi:hypothetical protein
MKFRQRPYQGLTKAYQPAAMQKCIPAMQKCPLTQKAGRAILKSMAQNRHQATKYRKDQTMPKPNTKTFPELAATFAPYHTMPGFQRGHEDYMDGNHDNPFDPNSLQAQAWTRGHMAAALFTQQGH